MTSAMAAFADVPTTGSVELPPDPRSLEALGRNHTLEAAVAELVDNSIDAHAGYVLIRFVRDGGRLLRLVVVDDGAGMDDSRIDVAMTIGGARPYEEGEIGRFGLGLKAASFSQARTVTVLAKAAGSRAVGRQWHLAHAKRDFSCRIVDSNFAQVELAQSWGFPESLSTGTLVCWDDVRGFPSRDDDVAAERFLQHAFARIRSHLGLVFHRILERSDVRLFLDVEDLDEGVLGRTVIEPLNPFAYPRTGARGWPKSLRVGRRGRSVTLHCHIWPGRSSLDEFRLDGNLIERQGLYVYYNDRLIQRGGWNELEHPDKQLALARIAVDVDGDIEGMLRLKPEKNGIEVGPEFAPAVYAAKAAKGGTRFSDYIDEARGVQKEANRRRRVRSAVLPPGAGFDPKLRRAIGRELPLKDDDAIDVRWTRLPRDQFFEVDRDQRTLWLNQRYRRDLLGGRSGSKNDLPLVKALMFLLVEHIFAGQNMGPRDKDNLEVWQAVLASAAHVEAS